MIDWGLWSSATFAPIRSARSKSGSMRRGAVRRGEPGRGRRGAPGVRHSKLVGSHARWLRPRSVVRRFSACLSVYIREHSRRPAARCTRLPAVRCQHEDVDLRGPRSPSSEGASGPFGRARKSVRGGTDAGWGSGTRSTPGRLPIRVHRYDREVRTDGVERGCPRLPARSRHPRSFGPRWCGVGPGGMVVVCLAGPRCGLLRRDVYVRGRVLRQPRPKSDHCLDRGPSRVSRFITAPWCTTAFILRVADRCRLLAIGIHVYGIDVTRVGSSVRRYHNLPRSCRERSCTITKVVAIMSMSLDGYVADANDGVARFSTGTSRATSRCPQRARHRA
jgi:hypothetical protein